MQTALSTACGPLSIPSAVGLPRMGGWLSLLHGQRQTAISDTRQSWCGCFSSSHADGSTEGMNSDDHLPQAPAAARSSRGCCRMAHVLLQIFRLSYYKRYCAPNSACYHCGNRQEKTKIPISRSLRDFHVTGHFLLHLTEAFPAA